MLLSSQTINIVFRYDDFRLVNDSTDEKIVLLFQKYHIPLVLGVIPCDSNEHLVLDKNYHFLNYLKSAVHSGEIEIALHGLNHKRMTPYGEFKGLSLEEQTRRIREGKHLLDSIFDNQIATFIPPWNAHDDNTVKALKTNQIYIVSSSVYDVWYETVYYPMSTDDFYQLETLVNNNQTYGGLIVVMLHSYNFKTPTSFTDFERILINVKQNKSVYYNTFRELEAKHIYVNKYQTFSQIKQNILAKILKTNGIFITKREILIIQILNSLIYLLGILLLYYFAQLIFLKNHKHNMIRYFILFLFSIVIVLSTWFCWWGPLKLILIFSLIALLLPFVFEFFKLYDLKIKLHINRKNLDVE
jgi:peptidoglycan/xylan/chitin deacetylase (PgdA/CDA1 family)